MSAFALFRLKALTRYSLDEARVNWLDAASAPAAAKTAKKQTIHVLFRPILSRPAPWDILRSADRNNLAWVITRESICETPHIFAFALL